MTENHLVKPFADDDAVVICECGEEINAFGRCPRCARNNNFRADLREIFTPLKPTDFRR